MFVYFQNVRGLRTKLHLLYENVSYSQYDILVINETWLTGDIDSAELQMLDYNIYRRDRSPETSTYSRGGGVLIAVRKTLTSTVLAASKNIEHLFVKIDIDNSKFIFATAYFPPRSAPDKYMEFTETVDRLSEEFAEYSLCILGDFNLPYCRWSNDGMASAAGAPPAEVESTQLLSFLCSYHNLHQVNTVRNAGNNLLDLVFVRDGESEVFAAEAALLPVDVHHPPLSFELKCKSCFNDSGLIGEGFYRDFQSMNVQEVIGFLSQFNWDDLLMGKTLDNMVNVFYDIIYLTIDIFVPLKRYSAAKFPIWFSPELKQKIIDKKKMHSRYSRTRLLSDYNEFSLLRTHCKHLKRQCYQDYVAKTESSLRDNVKNFWKFVNSKKSSCSLPSVMHYNNFTSSSGMEIANLFAEYFSKTYSVENCVLHDTTLPSGDVNLSQFSIPISSIYEKLSKLDITKGPGPDGLPPSLIKHCSFLLSRPLFHIFNLSLKSGTFPAFWKVSFVTPILKSGDRSQVNNYRPISILSCIPKVFESFVCDFLSAGLQGCFIDQQFGFLSHRSTELNLLTFTDFLLESLEEGYSVHAVYTDFTKAFDRVDHAILISKLHGLGIQGKFLEWLSSYLTERIQLVRIQGFQSKEIKVPSGVPQGSHLGPLLFNIYVNDIASCFVSARFLMFADDLKLYMKFKHIDNYLNMQADLDRLSHWCEMNGMELNVQKCRLMVFSRNRDISDQIYTINGRPLESVSQIKDLGVILDSNLSFVPHISESVSRSLRMLGFVKRCTKDFLAVRSIKLLFCSLVRPHLDYCSCVWSPHYNVHIQAIERVQHKFLRFISFREHQAVNEINYSDVESSLNITTLQVRRMHKDLTLFYSLLHSHSFSPELLGKIDIHVPSRQTRLVQPFQIRPHRTNYGYNSYLSRSARFANRYSDRLDCFGNIKAFGSQLKFCL